jgi:hypothetical protein
MLKGANAGGAWYPALTRATPENPPNGQLRLYGKANQPSLFYRDHLGNEYELRPNDLAIDSAVAFTVAECLALRELLAVNFR